MDIWEIHEENAENVIRSLECEDLGRNLEVVKDKLINQAGLIKACKDKEEIIKKLKVQNSLLTQEYQKLKAREVELPNNLATLKQEKEMLELKLMNLQRLNEQLTEERKPNLVIFDLESKINALKKAVNSKDNKILTLKQQLAGVRESFNSLQEQREKQSSSLLVNMEAEVNKLRVKVKKYKLELQAKEKELLRTYKQLDLIRRKYDKLKLVELAKKNRFGSDEIVKRILEGVCEIVKDERSIKKRKLDTSQDMDIDTHDLNTPLIISPSHITHPSTKSNKPLLQKPPEPPIQPPQPPQPPALKSALKQNHRPPEPPKAPRAALLPDPVEVAQESLPLELIQNAFKKSVPVPMVPTVPTIPTIPNFPAKLAKPEDKKLPEKSLKSDKGVYMQPYEISTDPTSSNYLPTYSSIPKPPFQPQALQAPSESLPGISKAQEAFSIMKSVYSSDYEFNTANLYLVSEAMKTMHPSTIASYLVQEFAGAVSQFSYTDALEILHFILNELFGNLQRDFELLSAMRSFLISNAYKGKIFEGKMSKFPERGYKFDRSLQSLLHTSYILLCKKYFYQPPMRDLLYMLMIRNDTELVSRIFIIWPDFKSQVTLFSIKTFITLYENPTEQRKILQQTSMNICQANEHNYLDYYKTIKFLIKKSVISTQSSQEAYDIYAKYLWPAFVSALSESYTRVIVLKSIGQVIKALDSFGSHEKTVSELKSNLEEILTDTQFSSNFTSGFSMKEQKAAATTLKKLGISSAQVENWLRKYDR